MKFYVLLIAFALFMSLTAFAVAEEEYGGGDMATIDSDADQVEINSRSRLGAKADLWRGEYGNYKNYTNKTNRTEIRDGWKERRRGLWEELKDKREEKIRIHERDVRIELTDEQKIEIMIGRINAKTGLNLTVNDTENITLGQVLRAYLSNGRWAEVKVMPDTAAEIALKRLRAKCAERNCTVELKEIANNRTNKTRIAYEIETEKGSNFLLIFNGKMKVRAVVDAETGEVISVRKPWWAFLSKEEKVTDEEIEAEIETESEAAASSK